MISSGQMNPGLDTVSLELETTEDCDASMLFAAGSAAREEI